MFEFLINADDFGLSEEVNEAIIYGFQQGLLDRTSLMVNMPFCDDAVRKARQYGFDDKVGLHLNLVQGTPLTEPIKNTFLCNQQGVFDDRVMKKAIHRLFLGEKEKGAVKIEIDAQIEKYIGLNIGQKHIDSHRHAHVAPSIFPLVVESFKQYNFCSMRLARNIPKNEIGGLKRLLKSSINRQILNLNVRNQEIMCFGSMTDVEKEIKNGRTNSNIEVMVHPVMKNGKFCDAIENESVEEWLSRNENCICNTSL